MSAQPIAAYSFIPWARQGLGIYIRENDLDATVKIRGSIAVTLELTGEQIAGGPVSETLPPRPVELYGPGDITGIDAKAIIRNEPRYWTTNFETNYVPFVEFYDEDFPWRYTPAKPSADQKHLRPWITLVVLEESEIVREGTGGFGRPLPFIEVANAAQIFPPADQLWAWAHVHVNGSLPADAANAQAVAAQLDQTVRANRDLAYARLLCPRILKANTAYHAFVIPSFESGRLSGLGQNPDEAPFATASAWADYAGRKESTLFPYYHRWFFRSAAVGDFEYLVRLLKPRTVDARVGRRDMDVQAPGANLPGIPELGGILRLGGALRAPLTTLSADERAEYDRFEQWARPYPHAFQTGLASLINLAEDYRAAGVAQDEDPLIVPPLYGRWHTETQRLTPADADQARKRWVHELNLDPRHRVAAGFGTQVVQKHQEDYMEAAWQQVGKVLEANQKIRYGQMAKAASLVWHNRELKAIADQSPAQFLTVAAPVHRRVLASGLTVQYQVHTSALPAVAMSKTMRQAQRPRARIARLIGYDAARPAGDLLPRMNLPDGDPNKVTAAPPKVVAPTLPTGEKLAEELGPRGIPRPWLDAIARNRVLLLIVALLIALLLLFMAPMLGIAFAAVVVAAAAWIAWQFRTARAADVLNPETRTPASVEDLRLSPDFHIGVPGTGPAPQIGTTDSTEAQRFKDALRNLYTVDEVERTFVVQPRRPIDLPAMATATIAALDPAVAVPARVLGSVHIPARIGSQLPETFDEVMVYPEIDIPMYGPLNAISSELFVPNVQLIENNSITLLETNQPFIEAYMVGLNHEFSRELLWREYPTDQRGSCFRQFWDVSTYLAAAATDPQALRERLRDIPELHRWRPTQTSLGEHDHREEQGDKEDEVVLVIRGELLKRYPTAVIYAHRADWERSSGAIDKSHPRKLAPLTEAEALNPSREVIRTPLYEAKVDPDIYFFGFDLTAEKARGGQIVNGDEDPGWFFVIKERPGEPRFGLDLPRQGPPPTLNTWNDLAWTDVLNAYAPGGFLRVGEKTVTLTDPGTTSVAKQQYDEDSRFIWRADTHAAELAYILYQVPVLMAVHAAEMLKRIG